MTNEIPLHLRKQRSLPHGIFRPVFGKTASLIRPDPEEAVYVEWIELEELHRAVKAEPEKYTPSLRAEIIKIFQKGYGKYIF